VGNLLGIFLDKRYISAPRINSPIYDSGQIEGNFTQEQTITLANELDAGALPAQIKIIENENIDHAGQDRPRSVAPAPCSAWDSC